MSKPVILWVDDSDDDALLVQRAFAKSGVSSVLIRVADGCEATEYLLGKGRFDDRGLYPLPRLLLLDVKMPRMSGFDVLVWRRSRPELAELPVVMLSSSTQSEDIEKAYELGAEQYLVKPSDQDDLIQQILELHQRWIHGSV